MPDFVRVRDKSTGHEYTEIKSVVEANSEAYDVFSPNSKDHPALDHNGDPVPPVFASDKSGQKANTTKENS